jgi:hypothetical protein
LLVFFSADQAISICCTKLEQVQWDRRVEMNRK